jgi:cystathionine beta-lyase/cystathionine gamma-synthase
MAAIETLMSWAWIKFDQFYVQSEIYRKSEAVISNLRNLSDRSVTFLERNSSNFTDLHNPKSFFFFEFPSNPHLRISSLWSEISTTPDRPFVFVDATLSGLGNLNQDLENAVDVVCYSLTKYIGGHNDLIGGVLYVKSELYEEIWETRSRMGNIIGPVEAQLCQRSLQTFSIRFQKQCENALIVLEGLLKFRELGLLEDIFYPGSASNESELAIAKKTIGLFGSVISFVVPGDRNNLAEKLKGFKSVKISPSFGSTDSLIEICSLMSRPTASSEELAMSGLEPNLVRLSVGLEDPNLVLMDIRKLLG